MRVLDFGATIVYPESPKRKGFTFNGWDNSITSMPAYDLNITAQWLPSPKESMSPLVIGIIVLAVVVVIAVIIVVAAVFCYRNKNTGAGLSEKTSLIN